MPPASLPALGLYTLLPFPAPARQAPPEALAAGLACMFGTFVGFALVASKNYSRAKALLGGALLLSPFLYLSTMPLLERFSAAATESFKLLAAAIICITAAGLFAEFKSRGK